MGVRLPDSLPAESCLVLAEARDDDVCIVSADGGGDEEDAMRGQVHQPAAAGLGAMEVSELMGIYTTDWADVRRPLLRCIMA